MLDVTFYGVRGSTPCSCDGTRGIGGNTSCVLVEVDGEPPIILDCGTGLRYLGLELVKRDGYQTSGPFTGTALLSHLHWDHVQGLPFFVPILEDGAELLVVGPEQTDGTLADAIGSFVGPPLFPIDLDVLPGQFRFHERGSGSFQVGSATVTVAAVPHVGNTNGYRIDAGEGSVAYLSDHQQPSDGSFAVPDQLVALCEGVDVLIHDAQYSVEEFVTKSTWGHSTPEYAVEVARRSGAKRLLLFHHDPTHDDQWVVAATERAQRLAGDAVEVLAAQEGISLRSGATHRV